MSTEDVQQARLGTFTVQCEPFAPPPCSLRDWFAAMALRTLGVEASADHARWCYEVADAMLAEREKKRQQ